MKTMNRYFLSLFLVTVFSFSIQAQEKLPFSVEKITAPIVKRQTDNPVFIISSSQGGSVSTINGLQLKVTNASQLQDISLFVDSIKKYTFTPQEGVNKINLPKSAIAKGNKTTIVATAHPNAIIGGNAVFELQTIQFNSKKYDTNLTSKKHVGIEIVKKGDDSIKYFRIPGMVTTKKGTLVAVYDIRYEHGGDLPADIDVGMSRSEDGGQTWSNIHCVVDVGGRDKLEGVGDPSILVDEKTGRLWMAFLWAHNGKSLAASKPGLKLGESGQFCLAYSDDDGLRWSVPMNITQQVAPKKNWRIYFNGPGNGIMLSNGTLVFASQYWDEKGMPYSSIIYSKNGGVTWQSGVGARENTTEAQVVELNDGSVMLNMRDNRGGSRAVMTTTDLGQTWKEHPTNRNVLLEPVCQASILRVASTKFGDKKDILAFFNPFVAKAPRRNMTLQFSFDEGNTWQYQTLINQNNCWGYSSISMVDKETIGLLYETEGGLIFEKRKLSEIFE